MASYSAWCPELERALAEPFPPEVIQQKRIKGSSISFIPWHLYVARLNALVGPGWSTGEPILREVGGKLVMGIPLTIFGVTRTNFGSEEEEHGNAGEDGVVRDFGSAETNAFAQAFKRSCALFGLGLSMYDKTGNSQRIIAEEQRRKQQDAEHASLLVFIRDVGERCDEEVTFTYGGKASPIKAWIRENWKDLKSKIDLARDAAKAIEGATGQKRIA